MKINFKKYFTLIAIASLFAVTFISCSKEELNQDGGGGNDTPPTTKLYTTDKE